MSIAQTLRVHLRSVLELPCPPNVLVVDAHGRQVQGHKTPVGGAKICLSDWSVWSAECAFEAQLLWLLLPPHRLKRLQEQALRQADFCRAALCEAALQGEGWALEQLAQALAQPALVR